MFNEEKYVEKIIKWTIKNYVLENGKMFDENPFNDFNNYKAIMLYLMNEFDLHLTLDVLKNSEGNAYFYYKNVVVSFQCLDGFDKITATDNPIAISISFGKPNLIEGDYTFDENGVSMYANIGVGVITKARGGIVYYSPETMKLYNATYRNDEDEDNRFQMEDILDPDDKVDLVFAEGDNVILEEFKAFVQFVKAKRNELLESDEEKKLTI